MERPWRRSCLLWLCMLSIAIKIARWIILINLSLLLNLFTLANLCRHSSYRRSRNQTWSMIFTRNFHRDFRNRSKIQNNLWILKPQAWETFMKIINPNSAVTQTYQLKIINKGSIMNKLKIIKQEVPYHIQITQQIRILFDQTLSISRESGPYRVSMRIANKGNTNTNRVLNHMRMCKLSVQKLAPIWTS